jgi:hypothetical protein
VSGTATEASLSPVPPRTRPPSLNVCNTPSSIGGASIFSDGVSYASTSPMKPGGDSGKFTEASSMQPTPQVYHSALQGHTHHHPHAPAANPISPSHARGQSHIHPFLEAGEKFSGHTLNVFFSAPLAGFDRNAKPHPLEVLDYASERELLIQVFREVHRDVNVHFDFATTDSLRTALSFGCKALHFSGHGIPKGLCFEDGRLGLQVVKVNQLKDLLGAGGLQLQFVFVSACYSSEIGDAFVKAGVPHVVCVKVDTKVSSLQLRSCCTDCVRCVRPAVFTLRLGPDVLPRETPIFLLFLNAACRLHYRSRTPLPSPSLAPSMWPCCPARP